MVDTIGLANAVGGSPLYTGRQGRQLNGVAFAGATAARPLGVITGVRPGTTPNTVTVSGTLWTCFEFAGIADVMVAGESGAYPFSFDAAASGSLMAADSTNPRVDILYVQLVDPEDGSTVPTASRNYLAGMPAANPQPPQVPAGAFVVAQFHVPAAGSGSASVTWVAPTTVAAGGVIPYPTKAAMPSAGPLGQVAIVDADPITSNNRLWFGTGTGWTHSLNGAEPFATSAGTATVPTVNAGAFGAVNITFPAGHFTQPPIVVAVSGNSRVTTAVSNITTTGATLNFGNWSGGATASSFSAWWTATQMTSTAAAG